jgi:hypothetical protein
VKLIENFKEAELKEIEAVHDPLYVQFVRDYCERGGGFLGDSTYCSPFTYTVARTAVQGAISGAEMVVKGKHDSTFAFIRPPGHHATRDRYSGYCIFNNGAIVARHLRRMKKSFCKLRKMLKNISNFQVVSNVACVILPVLLWQWILHLLDHRDLLRHIATSRIIEIKAKMNVLELLMSVMVYGDVILLVPVVKYAQKALIQQWESNCYEDIC